MEVWKTFFDEADSDSDDDDTLRVPSPKGPQTRSQAPAPTTATSRAQQRLRDIDPAFADTARWLDEMNDQSRYYFRLSMTNG
ncbi:hypothetical protein CMUS01_12542 [Colletotrichum musicola]|uniref:Uncharacterized protein n=1 Tax=Colletotrichum musicola TaxID=2175873 RepID=A0A8H6MZQ4_9PEZI|nr:hypothetical protein CMUS01_12542 [Colletotrichum musicola]